MKLLCFFHFGFETKNVSAICPCVPPGRDGEYFPPLENIYAGECFWLITDNIREILFREILIGEILIGEILIRENLIGEILMTNKNLSDKL